MRRSLSSALSAVAALTLVTAGALVAQSPATPPASTAATVPALAPDAPAPDSEAAWTAWKEWRKGRLSGETSWLTLVGLHWLEPGDNALGSAPGTKLLLPDERSPAVAGAIRLEGGKATLLPAAGVTFTVEGQPLAGPTPLGSDADEDTTLVELGPLNFYVISRGDRLGIRVRDREAPLRKAFTGLDYFPFAPAARVEARFEPNPPGTTVPVANVLGMTDPMPSPGKVTFTLGGETHTLTALDDTGDGRLYLIVGDRTNGYDTYGAGRFLYADAPVDGKTIVDFNRAYNPPCAFTPWSTCQLPPRENKLPIRIEAGEKKFVSPLEKKG